MLKQELADTIADILNQIELNFDPVEQVNLAPDMNEVLLDAQKEVAEMRRRAVRTLRMQGWGLKEIADQTGMSHQRVSQIELGADRKEKS
jgi:DNA-directed RNA polymerase sigma subunit (sigma70/sigma32)